MPVGIAFAIMLLFTFMTALGMALEGSTSSPAVLLVCGVVTALLGRLTWFLARR
jgi:hypothetical protein